MSVDYPTHPCAFIDKFFPRNERGEPWTLSPHHRKVIETALRFDANGRLRLRLLLWGEMKKSAKTFVCACLGLWWAMTQGPTEVVCYANDFDQSQGRVFATMAALCKTNGFEKAKLVKLRASEIRCNNGSVIRAVASDYKGEAGARQTLAIFDELWGFESERAERLFEEATPIPTAPSAWILIATTAGFVGESKVLERLYERGLAAERIDDDLELYRDGEFIMFWSHTPRQPWQTAEYYAEQRKSLRPSTYLRLHENRWVSSEGSFIEAAQWDACVDHLLAPITADPDLPIYVGIDAGVKSDTSAVVAVAWEGRALRLVTHRVWKPTKGQPLNLEHTIERFVRELDAKFDLQAAAADPWQLYRSLATLKADGIAVHEQPFNASSTTLMTQTLYDTVLSGSLRVYPSDDLRTAVLNASVSESSKGLKLTKTTASRKIDLAVALMLAVRAALQDGPDQMPLMLASGVPLAGSAYAEWQARGSWGSEEPEPHDDAEVIEMSEAEMAQRPDRDAWVPLEEPLSLPRRERKRLHHHNVESIAQRGSWFPEDV